MHFSTIKSRKRVSNFFNPSYLTSTIVSRQPLISHNIVSSLIICCEYFFVFSISLSLEIELFSSFTFSLSCYSMSFCVYRRSVFSLVPRRARPKGDRMVNKNNLRVWIVLIKKIIFLLPHGDVRWWNYRNAFSFSFVEIEAHDVMIAMVSWRRDQTHLPLLTRLIFIFFCGGYLA